MKTNKYCCRIFPVMLIVIAFVITLGIWYFEDGVQSLNFLKDKNEIFNFLGAVLFVAIIPIGIFYLATEKERFKNNAKKLALLGFLPALLFLVYTLL